eukprot:CAMPEP_0202685498 /NCGR_PEP_ID=MMETSP1385-20130828/1280_1 /ASSEMBLY_ACC=CAM_ASM_000861 /TAXON_ID=933848 /ORGANISM="Elphidium margaritaceum" /LENGTH=572 /DNA_ID=CAMNT_0049339861 /DNA_START=136 /DNA_END=1854 /DNA_ORIENTATION=+
MDYEDIWNPDPEWNGAENAANVDISGVAQYMIRPLLGRIQQICRHSIFTAATATLAVSTFNRRITANILGFEDEKALTKWDNVEKETYIRFVQFVGGAFPKLLQRVAMRRDLVSQEFSQLLQSHVFENNKARPLPDRLRGTGLVEVNQVQVRGVEAKPLSVGSVGQVHSASLKTGERVVIKIVFAELKQQYEHDLNVAASMEQTVHRLDYCANSNGLHIAPLSMIVNSAIDATPLILNEFDLRIEARYQETAQGVMNKANQFFKGKGLFEVSVPKIYGVTTEQTLIQSFERGVPLHEYLRQLQRSASSEEYSQFIKKTLRTVFLYNGYSLFYHGFIHGDPHFGNFLFDDEQQVLHFIDWGQSIVLSQQQRKQFCEAFRFVAEYKFVISSMSVEKLAGLTLDHLLSSPAFLENVDAIFMQKITSLSEGNPELQLMVQKWTQMEQSESSSVDKTVLRAGLKQQILRVVMQGFVTTSNGLLVDALGIKMAEPRGDHYQEFLMVKAGVLFSVLDTDQRISSVDKYKKYWKYMNVHMPPQTLGIAGTLNILGGMALQMNVPEYSSATLWKEFATTCP